MFVKGMVEMGGERTTKTKDNDSAWGEVAHGE